MDLLVTSVNDTLASVEDAGTGWHWPTCDSTEEHLDFMPTDGGWDLTDQI